MVCPEVSTARYRYFHWPLTLKDIQLAVELISLGARMQLMEQLHAAMADQLANHVALACCCRQTSW